MPAPSPATLRYASMRANDPGAWREALRDAVRKHGNVREAARALGIPWRRLYAWIEVDKMTAELGLPGSGNRSARTVLSDDDKCHPGASPVTKSVTVSTGAEMQMNPAKPPSGTPRRRSKG